MNILFVLGSVYPIDDANSNIINRIAVNLSSRQTDINIYELGFDNQNMSISKKTVNGVTIYGMGDPLKTRFSEALKSYLDDAFFQQKNKLITHLIRKPNLAIEYIFKKVLYGNIQRSYRTQIKKICIKDSIDVVICVSYPFSTAMAAAKLKKKLPFIYYQLDPYFNHYLSSDKRKALKHERYVCKKADAILMTNLIYDDYMHSPLKKYLLKTSVLQFPIIELSYKYDNIPDLVDEEITKFAYVGTLYKDIRSPSYLFSIMKELVFRGNKVHLDLVGPLVGDIEIPKAEWLTYHGRLSVSEAKVIMQQADILVNIGNSIRNQMPSKIFEYFSTGKPIINLFKIDNCPTLPYTNRYPNCISLDESKDLNENICEQIENFIKQYKGCLIHIDKVMDMFYECTTQNVSDQFLEVVHNVINKKRRQKNNYVI